MKHLATKMSQSPSRHRLIEAMQQLSFGRIENLAIQNGEPVFSPPPRLIQDIKLGAGENGPRPELYREDFMLRSSVIELFHHLERIGSGNIAAIEVRHGLPFRIVIDRSAGDYSGAALSSQG